MQKKILCPDRIRKIQGSFSWIDHRFITDGFLSDLTPIEILLYFFLVAVSDRQGISFYHDDRICRLLKIDLAHLGTARSSLLHRSLLAHQSPIYQILSLPDQPVNPPSSEELAQLERQKALIAIKKIKEVLS
jgi:hypothetical protein